MSNTINDHLVLVGGKSAAGKSASLMNLVNPEKVMYLNCESGKRLPFRAGFRKGPDGSPGFVITKPSEIPEAFAAAENMDVDRIVVDSLTYLLDMYESMYVLNSTNGMKAWGDFAQYFKNLMQQSVARSKCSVVFTAHTLDVLNEGEMVMETKVPVKGSLKNNGIESYFSVVLAAKKMSLKNLEKYQNDLLVVTPLEESLGFKYVFQTQLTKETVNERLRGPIGMWTPEETFIDNDMQKVFDRLDEYYGDVQVAA
jgi:hypothetical protein